MQYYQKYLSKMYRSIFLLYMLIGTADFAKAQLPGTLDLSFEGKGFVHFPMQWKPDDYFYLDNYTMQRDGKLLAINTNYTYIDSIDAYNATLLLYRFLPNGTPDPTFGTNGASKLPYPVSKILLPEDGSILLVGSVDDVFVAKLNPNGIIDSTYGTNGIVRTGLFSNSYAAALGLGNKIVVSGSVLASTKIMVACLMADGSRDFSFGEDGYVLVDLDSIYSEWPSTIMFQPDGKILLSGYIYKNGYVTALSRLLPNGSSDPTFSSDGKMAIGYVGFMMANMVLQGDNKIVLTGYYNYNNGARASGLVCRVKENGNQDSTFGVNGVRTLNFNGQQDMLHDLVMQPDGRILTCGTSDGKFAVARLTTAGILDPSFNTTGKTTTNLSIPPIVYASGANHISLLPDGKILLAGFSQQNDSMGAFSMAHYHTGINVGLEETETEIFASVYPNPIQNEINLGIHLLEPGNVSVTLMDITGKEIASYSLKNRIAGHHNEVLGLPVNMLPGMYFLTVTNNKTSRTIKLLKE